MKYNQLIVWQKSMDLVLDIYSITKTFPQDEKFGLISQLRRAIVSIPSNIAEGHGRKYTNIFLNHISVSFGSLMEVETQLHIACRLGYINLNSLNQLFEKTDEIGKMLCGLKKSLEGVNNKVDPDRKQGAYSILNPKSSILEKGEKTWQQRQW